LASSQFYYLDQTSRWYRYCTECYYDDFEEKILSRANSALAKEMKEKLEKYKRNRLRLDKMGVKEIDLLMWAYNNFEDVRFLNRDVDFEERTKQALNTLKEVFEYFRSYLPLDTDSVKFQIFEGQFNRKVNETLNFIKKIISLNPIKRMVKPLEEVTTILVYSPKDASGGGANGPGVTVQVNLEGKDQGKSASYILIHEITHLWMEIRPYLKVLFESDPEIKFLSVQEKDIMAALIDEAVAYCFTDLFLRKMDAQKFENKIVLRGLFRFLKGLEKQHRTLKSISEVLDKDFFSQENPFSKTLKLPSRSLTEKLKELKESEKEELAQEIKNQYFKNEINYVRLFNLYYQELIENHRLATLFFPAIEKYLNEKENIDITFRRIYEILQDFIEYSNYLRSTEEPWEAL